MGTTQTAPPRRMTKWLPFWRRRSKPSRSSARATFWPETQGSLGMSDLEGGEKRRGAPGKILLLQIQLRGLLQVRQSLFHGAPLARCACFRVESHQPALRVAGINNCGQSLHARKLSDASLLGKVEITPVFIGSPTDRGRRATSFHFRRSAVWLKPQHFARQRRLEIITPPLFFHALRVGTTRAPGQPRWARRRVQAATADRERCCRKRQFDRTCS